MFGFLIYSIFRGIDSVSPLKNIILTLIFYFLLTSYMSLLMFNSSLHGSTLDNDEIKIIKNDLSNSVPFHGLYKLVSYTIKGELFSKVVKWTDTNVGQAITNIPLSSNLTNNNTCSGDSCGV